MREQQFRTRRVSYGASGTRIMSRIELFVIGASAGGLAALRAVTGSLPADFPAAICLVMHLSPDSPGTLPDIVAGFGALVARNARDGDALRPGCILVAQPDRHLLVGPDRRLCLSHGAKENRFRPAIDPLFRSAAVVLGGAAAGLILSGDLDDGAAGLRAIQARGGAVLVQDPADAQVPSMPRAALRAVGQEHAVATGSIAERMILLSQRHAPAERATRSPGNGLMHEVAMAAGGAGGPGDLLKLGEPSLITCPECSGALVRLRDPVPSRFRCHTGHAYTTESLAAAMLERAEENLWSAIRSLEEYAFLQERIAADALEPPDRRDAACRAAEATHARSALVRKAVKA